MPGAIYQTTPFSVPEWVTDLESFSRWAESAEFPTEGRISLMRGHIWIDPGIEQLYAHNLVKLWISIVLAQIGREEQLGNYFADRARLVNASADLSTEPDGLFVTYEGLRAGRIWPVPATTMDGYREFAGTPDMVLEVLSESSEVKDRVELPEVYFRAGIREYWLADARGESPVLEIFRRGRKGFVGTKPTDGWVRSRVFDCSFRLVQSADPLGNPQYALEHRA